MKKGLAFIALLLVGAGVAAYFYFKGSEKHLQLVPKNAMAVATIDFKSLAVKADFDKIQQLNWFKDMQKKSSDMAKEDPKSKGLVDVISHPLSCGVNLLSDVYVFAANTDGGGVSGGLIFDIRDAGAFEDAVKKAAPDLKIESADNYKWVTQNEVALAWNKTGGIIAGSYNKAGGAKVKDFLDATFKRKLDESILANEQFKKFNVNRKDISYFINASELYTAITNNSTDPSSAMLLSSMNSQAKDVYYWSNVDFQNDRVLTTTHVESPATSANAASILAPTGLSAEHLTSITTKDCYALVSINCDVDKMFATYEAIPSFKQSLDQAAMMVGMSTKDLEHIFGGELSIALVDFKKSDASAQVSADPNASMMQQQLASMPLPVVVVNFSSKNKDGFKKLVESRLQPNADGYYHVPVYSMVSVNLAPNKFGYTLTNDESIAKTIAGGGAVGTLPANVNDLAKNNATVFYMNLDWSTYPQPLRDLAAQAMGDKNYKAFTAYAGMFKDVVAKGGQKDSELSLNLTAGSGNSLYRFFAQADESYKIVKQ